MKLSALTYVTALVAALAVTTLCWPQAAQAQTYLSQCDYDKVTDTETDQITTPGPYVLTNNLYACGGSCLTVKADNVSIDLAGFTISPDPDAGLCSGAAARGIRDDGTARTNVTVLNGTVTGFSSHGIYLGNTTGAVIHGVSAVDNNGTSVALGIYVGDAATVTNSYVVGNAHQGLRAGANSMVSQNTVLNNGAAGIGIGENGRADGNLVENNGGAGIGMFEGGIASGNIVNNNGYVEPLNPRAGISGRANTRAEDNVANNNAGSGISLGDGCTVTGNTTNTNGFDGIFVEGIGSTVTGNTAYGNSRDGIRVYSGGATLSDNTATANTESGITVLEYENTILAASFTSNSASDNGQHGIVVWCPSNVIGNTMSNNGGDDIHVAGGSPNECFFENNIPKKN